LHTRDAIVEFANPVIQLLNLPREPPDGLLKIAYALIESAEARILVLLMLKASRFLVVAFAEQTRNFDTLCPLCLARGSCLQGLQFRLICSDTHRNAVQIL
jgi:hypothetical protein